MSYFNFNDLPTEVQSLTFRHLEPVERALVLPTCQEWNQLIMGTQSYWRDLEVGEDCSFERLMEMLQAFTARSQNTMRSIAIDKLIEDKVELQGIFDVVTLSSSTIMILSICQRDRAGTLDSPTRQFARSLPNLHFLHSYLFKSHGYMERLPESSPIGSRNVLFHYKTHYLFDIQEEEMDWLSHLVSLKFLETDSVKNFISILRRNTSTLKSLDCASVKGSEDQTFAFDPLVFEVLSDLSLPTYPLYRPAFILPLAAPNLIALRGRISQLQAVTSPAVVNLTLELEEENQEWMANQSGTFLRDVSEILLRFPLVEKVNVGAFSRAFAIQLKTVLEALHSSSQEIEKPLLPQFRCLIVHHFEPITEMEGFIDLFVSRQDYRSKQGVTQEFIVAFMGKEEQLLFDKALETRQKVLAIQ